MRNSRLYFSLLAGMMVIFIFTSCSPSAPRESSEQTVSADHGSLKFPLEDYKKKVLSDRILLSEYKGQYQSDAKAVKHTKYSNFNYENCVFTDLSDVGEMELLLNPVHGITVQESWDTIENWLKEIGKQDAVDMKTDVRVVSPQFEVDESIAFPNCYVSFSAFPLEEQGKRLVKVDRFFASSQLCNVCGYKNSGTKDLRIRAWICPECSTHHDRDTNAAINIRNEGMRIVTA